MISGSLFGLFVLPVLPSFQVGPTCSAHWVGQNHLLTMSQRRCGWPCEVSVLFGLCTVSICLDLSCACTLYDLTSFMPFCDFH